MFLNGFLHGYDVCHVMQLKVTVFQLADPILSGTKLLNSLVFVELFWSVDLKKISQYSTAKKRVTRDRAI